MDAYTLHLQQASSAFTMSSRKAGEDFTTQLARHSDVVSFTEVHAHSHALALATACDHAGYQLVRDAEGDVAVAVKGIHKVHTWGVAQSVPGHPGPAAAGGHGPRNILWVTFQPFGTRERVTHHAAHWVTRKADTGLQQLQMTADLGDVVAAHSQGSRLGFWSGDTNSPDRPHDVTKVDKALRKAELTSCWDELGKWPATHEASTIDVIGSYDPDHRVDCVRGRRWPPGHSDHRAVSAWYRISPVRA